MTLVQYVGIACVVAFVAGAVMGNDARFQIRKTGSGHIAALAMMAILWPVTLACLVGTLLGFVGLLARAAKAKPDGG